MSSERSPSRPPFRVGGWDVYPNLDRIVSTDGELHVEPRVMDVLVYLAEHPQQVLPRSVIIDAVWPELYVADAVLTRAIAVLRKALGDEARAPRYIETIPKRGYRLIADVEGPRRRQTEGRHRVDAGGGQARFTLVMDDREVALGDGHHVVGRAADSDVQICASDVSRHHAVITVHADHLVIEDLGSKNGTWVSGTRLSSPQRLHDGDRLVLGSSMVVVRDSSSAPTRTLSGPGAHADDTDSEPTPPEPARTSTRHR